MSGRFDSKVPFVTGATSGIGRATALAFGREGASVVVADVATDGNQQTARMIEQAGGQSLAVSCDVIRADDIKAALDAAVERFGRLDIAVNNAGIEQPIKPAALDYTASNIRINARLCSDKAAFTIGHAMVVDGGQTA